MTATSPNQWYSIVRAYGLDDCSKYEEVKHTKLEDYKNTGDSISLAKIADAKFTIVSIEDSDFDDHGTVTPGVKIITKETFFFDSKPFNKLHTTRVAIVNRLKNQKLRDDLKKNPNGLGPLVCRLVPAHKGGKAYFDLVESA